MFDVLFDVVLLRQIFEMVKLHQNHETHDLPPPLLCD